MARICKNLIILVIRYIHSFLNLDKLSSNEKKGYVDSLSFFKFIKKSYHNLPFSNGLTNRGIHFRSNDPFCRALRLENNKIQKKLFLDIILNTLNSQKEKIVSDFIPVSADFKYSNYPIYCMAFPWDSHTFESFKSNYLEMVALNRNEHSSDVEFLTVNLIYSENFALSHEKQFNSLLASIKNYGFNAKLNRPRVIILKNTNRWKWMMSGQGNHRAYICSMLSYKNLPCEIINVVDRAKVKSWPNVVNGTYTKEHALEIFDLVFSGEHICKGIV